ncbi:MAG TPA: hypothetical protein VKH61_10470, partial [Streptosporangiaceae bacterium]|nr:hypothetical protein [Streptosporangiaceae bacterium]
HPGASRQRPRAPDTPVTLYDGHDPNIISCAAGYPAVIPLLMAGRRIGPVRHVQDGADDLSVIPASRKLSLARLTGSMPVPATGRVAAEDVRRTLGSDAERIDVRPVLGVNRVPARSALLFIRLILIGLSGLAIARAPRLVVLRPGPRFCQFCP